MRVTFCRCRNLQCFTEICDGVICTRTVGAVVAVVKATDAATVLFLPIFFGTVAFDEFDLATMLAQNFVQFEFVFHAQMP